MGDNPLGMMVPSQRRIIREPGRRVGKRMIRLVRQPKQMAPHDSEHHKRPKSEQRQRRVMLAARVNADEERQIRQAADRRGISVATLIRDAALADAAR